MLYFSFLYTISLFLYPAYYTHLYELKLGEVGRGGRGGHDLEVRLYEIHNFCFQFYRFLRTKQVIKNLIKLRKYIGCSDSPLFACEVWPLPLYLAPDTIKKSGVSPQVCRKHNINIVRTIIKNIKNETKIDVDKGILLKLMELTKKGLRRKDLIFCCCFCFPHQYISYMVIG